MTHSVPRNLGYYARSHWLQGSICLLLVVFVGAWLLAALGEAQERAEKLAVELTVRNFRTGMQLAMGEALMQHRESEIAGWVGSNPVRWLGAPPDGYRGECSAQEARALPGGAWCFELQGHELLYRPRNAGHLRILAGAEGRDDSRLLRWRVGRASEGVAAGGFVGLRVEIVTPYEWFLR